MKYVYAAAAMLVLASCGKKDEAVAPAKNLDLDVMYVKMAPVETGSGTLPIVGSGIVTSGNEAKPAFKTGGIIAKCYVREGDAVRAGQLLATLNMTEVQAYVEQATQGVSKAERDLARVRNLRADSVATLEMEQNATTALEVAKKQLEIAKFNQNFSEIRSPINGKVIKQIQHEGEVAGPGMPIYYILGLGSADWKINVGLSDKDWARTKVGTAATVKMDAFPGQTFAAKVTRVADVGNPQSGTFDVELKLTNPPKMAAGLVAQVQINPSASGTYMLLPIEALAASEGSVGTVYTVENGVARKQNVQILQLMGEKVAVSGGLNGAKEVISVGVGFLKDGDKVKVQ